MRQPPAARPGRAPRRGKSGECGCSVVRWLLACTVPSKAVPAQVRVTGAPELKGAPSWGGCVAVYAAKAGGTEGPAARRTVSWRPGARERGGRTQQRLQPRRAQQRRQEKGAGRGTGWARGVPQTGWRAWRAQERERGSEARGLLHAPRAGRAPFARPGCHGDGGGAQERREHVARGRPQARTRAARVGEAESGAGVPGSGASCGCGNGRCCCGSARGGRGGARRGGKLKSPAGGFDVCHTKDEESSVRVVGGLQVEGAQEEPRSFHEQAYPARSGIVGQGRRQGIDRMRAAHRCATARAGGGKWGSSRSCAGIPPGSPNAPLQRSTGSRGQPAVPRSAWANVFEAERAGECSRSGVGGGRHTVYGRLRTSRVKGSRGRSRGRGVAEGGDRVWRDMARATSKNCPCFAVALICTCIRTCSASERRCK